MIKKYNTKMYQCLNLLQTHTRYVLMLGKEGAVQCPCNPSDAYLLR